ncbi:hypothetical protein ACI798_16030 [Geodermatophilus sp. SYSU D01045]
MVDDAESPVPAAPPEALLVPLCWDGPQGSYEQREGVLQEAALLYARLTAGDPAGRFVVYRFLEAWREHLRLSLLGVVEDLPALTGEPLTLDGDDVFAHWSVVQDVLVGLWPDAAEDTAVTSRALIRLQTAFGSDRVDVGAVHREMLAAVAFFDGVSARAQAHLEFLRDRLDHLS